MADGYDVVVIGSGAAGLCAAIEAGAAGASVLLVESEGQIGGSSALSGGLCLAADTAVQRENGIEDSAQDLLYEYLLFNQFKVRPWLAKRLAYDSGPAVDWLIELGLEFESELVFGAEERAPRSHRPKGGGAAIVDLLAGVVKRHDATDIALGQRVTHLTVEDGAVRGVAVGEDAVSAGAVVIATGGFGANPSLWRDHLPCVGGAGGAAWYIGAAGARGDAFRFAAQVDARIEGNGDGLLLPTPDFFPGNLETYFPGWLVMVGRDGQRLVDEATSYAVMQLAYKDRGPVFAIFDEESRISTTRADEIDGGGGGGKHRAIASSVNWSAATIEEMVQAGKVSRASSLQELAGQLAIDQDGLAATARRYNENAAAGEDREFFKDPGQMRPLSSPPFYGVELRHAILCLTQTGPVTDEFAQVLDVHGDPIAGLYAAGECTGGVIGTYMGSGNAIANCLVFGRQAGKSAARAAGRRSPESAAA